MANEQSYKSHRRYYPLYHFVALPILTLNIVAQVLYFVRWHSLYKAWMVVVALGLATLAWSARTMALRAQDRVIRLEERLRLTQLVPPQLQNRIGELSPRQLVALRFAPDAEVAQLAERCLSGELKSAEEIKREIKSWREDDLRV